MIDPKKIDGCNTETKKTHATQRFICCGSKLVQTFCCHISHPSSPSGVPPSGFLRAAGDKIGFYPPEKGRVFSPMARPSGGMKGGINILPNLIEATNIHDVHKFRVRNPA